MFEVVSTLHGDLSLNLARNPFCVGIVNYQQVFKKKKKKKKKKKPRFNAHAC